MLIASRLYARGRGLTQVTFFAMMGQPRLKPNRLRRSLPTCGQTQIYLLKVFKR